MTSSPCGIAPAQRDDLTMKVSMILLSSFFAMAYSGLVTHHLGEATSYQDIHVEHFHPVPTYVRKEDLHLLEHPVSIGKTGTHVEVHHGNKHDQGYAIEGHGLEEEEGHAGHVHEDEGQEQGADYAVGQDHHYALFLHQGGYSNENGASYAKGGGESQHLQSQETSGDDQYQ